MVNFTMKKRIWIVGGGGSGKDFLRRKFENKGYTFGVYHTTRPKRSNETEGIDYLYIDNTQFNILNNEEFFIEYTPHNNDWYYGLSRNEYDSKDIFIISFKSYIKYSKTERDKAFKIFLDIDEEVRRERLSKRNDADSVERRLLSDKNDLEPINKSEFDLIIKNDNF